jgi:hypothetical protein
MHYLARAKLARAGKSVTYTPAQANKRVIAGPGQLEWGASDENWIFEEAGVKRRFP